MQTSSDLVNILFPNLSNLGMPVFYLHDGTYSERSILGVGIKSSIRLSDSSDAVFTLFDAFIQKPGWKMGYFSYNLKNRLERLESPIFNPHSMPDLFFVQPEFVFELSKGAMKVLEGKHHPDLEKVIKAIGEKCGDPQISEVELQARTSRKEYLEALKRIKGHIQQGDIYEMNYCQEFFNHDAQIDPFSVYRRVHEATQAPFSAYFNWDDHAIMCGSPERYIRKQGQKILSQPIKGTVRRGKDEQEDIALKTALKSDPKERAENIMITDLVRNDLSKVATKGSVQVDELCEVYSFKTVHQMITSISAQLRPDCGLKELVQATFPMGSMTGAPKVRAMQLIDELESTNRGVYSGAMGYIDPEGNMDFNVVIRSLLYHKKKRYLSALVGGAITSGSVPEKEYEECLLKADALFNALKP